MKLERIFFNEYNASCLYHPKPGCIHRSNARSATFISSLTDDCDHLHAPALDIDYPTIIETFDDETTRIEIKGPVPENRYRNDLLDALAKNGLMDSAQAQSLRINDPKAPRAPLPALPLCVPAHLTLSSTPGHFHLFIEHEMPWSAYGSLLIALRDAEIIGRDFCDMSLRWKVSFLLKPGLTKSAIRIIFPT